MCFIYLHRNPLRGTDNVLVGENQPAGINKNPVPFAGPYSANTVTTLFLYFL